MITVVMFLWQDPLTQWRTEYVYDFSFVLRMIAQIDKFMSVPHTYVLATNYKVLDGCDRLENLKVITIDKTLIKSSARYQKLMLFREDAAELFGENIFYTDLDNLFLSNIDHLVNRNEDFTIWQNPTLRKNTPYNSSLIRMKAGCRPHVYNEFDIKHSPQIVKREMLSGTDQAWISRVLSGEAMYTKDDGVYSFREDYSRANVQWREDASTVVFHGRIHQRAKTIREKFPQLYQASYV